MSVRFVHTVVRLRLENTLVKPLADLSLSPITEFISYRKNPGLVRNGFKFGKKLSGLLFTTCPNEDLMLSAVEPVAASAGSAQFSQDGFRLFLFSLG